MTTGEAFTLLGYVVGALVFYWAARQRRLATEGVGWIALAGLGGGIVGAKLTELLLMHGQQVLAHPGVLTDPRMGGRTIVGGIVFGWIAVEIAKRRLGIRRSTGDLFALALPIGEAIGRIGCYFNGCCYGTVCNMPWAIYQHGAWRHPTQFYTAGTLLVLFSVLLACRDRNLREGDLFRLYLLLWGASRFVLEFLRVRSLASGGLSLAQWACLELIVVSSVLLIVSRRRSGAAQLWEA